MRPTRRTVWWLALLALLTAGSARLAADEPPAALTPAEEQLASLRAAWHDRPLVSLTAGEIGTGLDLMSVAGQERAHVHRSAVSSWIAPGLGHYINGERGASVVFAAADLALGVMSAILVARLLPPSVQSRNLNYLQSSCDAIRTRWRSLTPAELIPATVVGVSSALLSLTVRSLAAADARRAALDALGRGTVAFGPRPVGLPPLTPSQPTPQPCSSPAE